MSGWRSTFGHIALLLWAFTALPVYAQSAPVQPKIVLQTLSKVLDAAAWTPDERYLLTVSGISREFIIWDVQQRLIIDRLRLPGEPNLIGAEMMRLTSIEVSADSRMVRVTGTVSAAQTEGNVVGRVYLIDLRLAFKVPAATTRLLVQCEPHSCFRGVPVAGQARATSACFFQACWKGFFPHPPLQAAAAHSSGCVQRRAHAT